MEEINLNTLKELYFSDPERTVSLQTGETLMEQHQHNDRLYLVLEGKVQGFLPELGVQPFPVFESGADKFVGVYSFFAPGHRSYTKVVAKEPTRLAYITRQNRNLEETEYRRYVNFFITIILNELADRQKYARKIAKERHDDLQKMVRVEKMATLGQMAAGLAHELNNSVGVIKSNGEWIQGQIESFIAHNNPRFTAVFRKGIEQGQFLSSSEARKYRGELEKKLNIPSPLLKRLARSGLDWNIISQLSDGSPQSIEQILNVWEIGANLHDMNIAVSHSSHVVQSVKTLGISRQVWIDNVVVEDTLREALTILKGILKSVEVEMNIGSLPPIYGCPGELIQVWINLVKNAAESMLGSATPSPKVHISANETPSGVRVTIRDNGPGIPAEIQESIFEPSFTTKVSGLSFGLGLGLSIVDRIISDHNGEIDMKSEPGKTEFIVTLPIGT